MDNSLGQWQLPFVVDGEPALLSGVPHCELQVQQEHSYTTGKLTKAPLYANILWCSSATVGQEPIRIILILVEIEGQRQFATSGEGIINQEENLIVTVLII